MKGINSPGAVFWEAPELAWALLSTKERPGVGEGARNGRADIGAAALMTARLPCDADLGACTRSMAFIATILT